LVALTVALVAAVARAQFDTLVVPPDPAVDKRSIEYLVTEVGLSAEQADSARDLHAAYTAQRADAARRIDEFQRAFRKSYGYDYDPKSDDWQRALRVHDEYGEHLQRLDARLMDDLRAVLTEGQQAEWSAYERYLRRSRANESSLMIGADLSGLARSAMSGQVVPLPRPSNNDKAMPRELLDVLDEYELEYDRVLSAIESKERSFKRTQVARTRSEKQPEEWSVAALGDSAKPLLSALCRAKELNLRYIERIADALPSNARERFEDWYYSGMDLQTPKWEEIRDALQSAKLAQDLSNEQAESIRAIEADARSRMRLKTEQVIGRMLDAIDRDEDLTQLIGEDPWQSPLMQEFDRDGKAILDSSIDRLRAVLTPEQLESMPEPLRLPGGRGREPVEFPTFPE